MKFKNVILVVLSCVLIFTSASAAFAEPSKEKHIRIVQQVRISKQVDASSSNNEAAATTADLGTGYLECRDGGPLEMVCDWSFLLLNPADKFTYVNVATTFSGPTVGSNVVSQSYAVNPATRSIYNQVEKFYYTAGTFSATINGVATSFYGGPLTITGMGSAQIFVD
jgi:hypothetical protein